MLVMPVHSAGGQNRFVGTSVSRCNETPYRRFYSPDLSVSLSFSRRYDRESAVVVANGYLPTRRLLSTFVSANLTALYVGKFSQSLEEVYG